MSVGKKDDESGSYSLILSNCKSGYYMLVDMPFKYLHNISKQKVNETA